MKDGREIAVPTAPQLDWLRMGYFGFVHFTITTFTNVEWEYGDKEAALFNPTDLDVDGMVRTMAECGMKGLILTCKHHDGFCLWPSAYTEYSVKNSPWKDGKGDLVREFSDACRRTGIQFGIYYSPWDRNHPEYGTDTYNLYFRNQLEELLTQYGDIYEVWFDGANGGDGYYGGACEHRSIDRTSYYDWETIYALVRKHQPQAVMFGEIGPDIRWIGNERGIAPETCWSTMNQVNLQPGMASKPPEHTRKEDDMVAAWASGRELLASGEKGGDTFIPGECDVSIRPGWFYHPEEDDRVKTIEELLEIYFRSVGHGCGLLLNLPPTPAGRFHPNDVDALQGLKKRLDAIFAENLADEGRFQKVDGEALTWELTLPEEVIFNVLDFRECLKAGQRIYQLGIEFYSGDGWQPLVDLESVGFRRLVRCGPVQTRQLRFRILQAVDEPVLLCPGLYFDSQLTDKQSL